MATTTEANKNAELLAAHVAPHVKDMPPLEGFMTIPIAVDVRFHKWDEILKMPRPDPEMKIMTVFWHFARGMALAAKGKVNEAEAEYQVVSDAEKNTPEDVVFAMPVYNKAKDVLKIARDVLGAKIALAKKDNAGAIALLQSAVAAQDTLKYAEPEDWFFPVRESLGAALANERRQCGRGESFPRRPRPPPAQPTFVVRVAAGAQGPGQGIRCRLCAKAAPGLVERRKYAIEAG